MQRFAQERRLLGVSLDEMNMSASDITHGTGQNHARETSAAAEV